MKKLFIIQFAVLFLNGTVFSQVLEDDFESNQFGWSERAESKGKAIIKDGVLHLESESKPVWSICYAPIDINKPFNLKVEALAKKISDYNRFGIILDYEDDYNYMLFYINDEEAKLEVTRQNQLLGYREGEIKIKKGSKVGIEFEIEYNLNELIFKVNGIQVFAYRRRMTYDKFILGTSGIGFYARQGAIDFDNLRIMQ